MYCFKTTKYSTPLRLSQLCEGINLAKLQVLSKITFLINTLLVDLDKLLLRREISFKALCLLFFCST